MVEAEDNKFSGKGCNNEPMNSETFSVLVGSAS